MQTPTLQVPNATPAQTLVDYALDAITSTVSNTAFGNIVGILGLIVSIVGFIFTVYQVRKSISAATAARAASERTERDVRRLDMIVDLSAVLTAMKEIKQHHRGGHWEILPDKYADLRSKLITIKIRHPDLGETEKTVLQGSIVQFRGIEKVVERSLHRGTTPANPEKLSEIVAIEIDKLDEVLASLKNRSQE
jgi:hypothetical protein